MLTFDRLVTNSVVHLIYWAGLALIGIGAFGAVGVAVGVALREQNVFLGLVLALPVIVGGLLVMAVLALLWRSFCEFYVAIFKISEDLAVLRADVEAERGRTPAAPTMTQSFTPPRV